MLILLAVLFSKKMYLRADSLRDIGGGFGGGAVVFYLSNGGSLR